LIHVTGTLINAGTVLAGSACGTLLSGRLPDRIRETVMDGLGLVVILVGVWEGLAAFQGPLAELTRASVIIVLGSVLVGGIIGELLRIEDRLNGAGEWLKRRVGSGEGTFTEGFGIVGPLAAGGVRASWRYLFTAGLVAGGPTLLGTIVGTAFTSQFVFVAFLTLAAGAIIYVVAELLFTGRRLGAWDVTVWGVLLGFLVGLATELVIVAAGG